MRWFWIDKFLEFESGRRAVALKNVSYGEEQIQDYVPGYGVMPASLIIEGLAQTGGLLVGELNGFRERVSWPNWRGSCFTAMPCRAMRCCTPRSWRMPRRAGPLCTRRPTSATALLAEAQIVFAHLDDRFVGVELFDPAEFLGILRSYGLYDVGRRARRESAGSPGAPAGRRTGDGGHVLAEFRERDRTLLPEHAERLHASRSFPRNRRHRR